METDKRTEEPMIAELNDIEMYQTMQNIKRIGIPRNHEGQDKRMLEWKMEKGLSYTVELLADSPEKERSLVTMKIGLSPLLAAEG